MIATLLFAAPAALSATWREVPSLSRVADESTCVIRGVVRSAETEEESWGLLTVYEVDVEVTLAGVAPRTVTVALPGGRTPDGMVQAWSGVPLWDEGDEVVVFLPRDDRMPLAGVLTVRDHELVDPLGRFPGAPPLDSDLPELLRAP